MPGTKDRDSVCVCVCVCVCVFYNFTGMEETHQLLIPMAIEVTYIIFRFGHMNSTNCRGKCREAGRGLLTMGLPRSTTWTCKQDPSAPSTWSHSSVVLSELWVVPNSMQAFVLPALHCLSKRPWALVLLACQDLRGQGSLLSVRAQLLQAGRVGLCMCFDHITLVYLTFQLFFTWIAKMFLPNLKFVLFCF